MQQGCRKTEKEFFSSLGLEGLLLLAGVGWNLCTLQLWDKNSSAVSGFLRARVPYPQPMPAPSFPTPQPAFQAQGRQGEEAIFHGKVGSEVGGLGRGKG